MKFQFTGQLLNDFICDAEEPLLYEMGVFVFDINRHKFKDYFNLLLDKIANKVIGNYQMCKIVSFPYDINDNNMTELIEDYEKKVTENKEMWQIHIRYIRRKNGYDFFKSELRKVMLNIMDKLEINLKNTNI